MSLIEPQRRLLGDSVRNAAFAKAIAASVRPGMRVAELGAGTGYLSVLAERAGAASVWACEGVPGLAALARQVAKANRCRRITVDEGHSTELAPPQPCDLLIAEVLGNIAGEEQIVDAIADAQRWLAPGARVIPSAVEQLLCPIVTDAHQRHVDAIDAVRDCDLSAVRHLVRNNVFVRRIAAADCLDGGRAAQVVDRMRFPGCPPGSRRGSAAWEPAQPATVHGLALWWSAELCPGVRLGTAPTDPETHWEQVYLPFDRALELRPGDRLACTLSIDAGFERGCTVAWQARHERRGKRLHSISFDNATGFI